MKKIEFLSTYFNISDTLQCGQIFRFKPYLNGYLVYSLDKCCYAYEESGKTIIETNDCDYDYFYNYFDLHADYKKIVDTAISSDNPFLIKCAILGKGIRILRQDTVETLFSFIVSQNNNIPRIKAIIEILCVNLGEEREFLGEKYYSFPSLIKMADAPLEFYRGIGLGYRAPYLKNLAQDFINGFTLSDYEKLSTNDLKKNLTKIYGVGPKVADCTVLFGFHRGDSFPVDTWIEKVYKEDFKGNVTDRNAISKYFVDTYKDNSGYFQQYMFYFKRSLDKK